jgi:hypothetical protein
MTRQTRPITLYEFKSIHPFSVFKGDDINNPIANFSNLSCAARTVRHLGRRFNVLWYEKIGVETSIQIRDYSFCSSLCGL